MLKHICAQRLLLNTNACEVMQSKPKFMNTNVHNEKFIYKYEMQMTLWKIVCVEYTKLCTKKCVHYLKICVHYLKNVYIECTKYVHSLKNCGCTMCIC